MHKRGVVQRQRAELAKLLRDPALAPEMRRGYKLKRRVLKLVLERSMLHDQKLYNEHAAHGLAAVGKVSEAARLFEERTATLLTRFEDLDARATALDAEVDAFAAECAASE